VVQLDGPRVYKALFLSRMLGGDSSRIGRLGPASSRNSRRAPAPAPAPDQSRDRGRSGEARPVTR
jgi:hypothetical protein